MRSVGPDAHPLCLNGILGCQNYGYFSVAVTKAVLIIQGVGGVSSMK